MIENIVANREFIPNVWLESQVTWLMPIASEPETRVWRSVSLAIPLTKTALPGLALANKNYNGSVKSNGHTNQLQTLLATTNTPTLYPWLMPYRTIGIYMNAATIHFVNITSLKQPEEKLWQNQQQLESLNKELTRLVAERTEQVRQLAAEVLITEQRVQQAISQLLHDDLQQLLVSIQIKMKVLHQLLSIDEPLLQDQIQEIHETVGLAFAVTRQVAVDLRPPFLLNEDFIESLNWLARVMKKRYGLTVTLTGTLRPGWPKEETSNFLLQTVRELLFNVVKHAGVNQAEVKVSAEGDYLNVTVSDDGQGFDVAATAQEHTSLGLFNMRRQIELFGGQLQIEARAGQGTRVTIMTLM